MGRSAITRAGLLALAAGIVLGAGGLAVADPTSPAAHPHGRKDDAVRCRLALGEVKDIRPDASMGAMGTQVVQVADPAAWTRDGLGALSLNHALEIVPADAHPDLTLKVELVKAYVQAMNTAKSATVVLRVGFVGRDAAPKIYRGVHTATNWINGAGEMQGALKFALDDAVRQLSADAPGLCAAGHAG
jgi:hypothetical protein